MNDRKKVKGNRFYQDRRWRSTCKTSLRACPINCNSSSKLKDKDCNFLDDLMLLVAKMPDGDCNLENIRELFKMLESIGKLIEKRREMAEHELYEKKDTDQIKDEDAIRRRKLNQGAWGTKAIQAKRIKKRKSLKYNHTSFVEDVSSQAIVAVIVG